MKRFYNRKNKKNSLLSLVVIFVIIFDIIIIKFFGNVLSYNICFLTKTKIEELTKYYLNETIKKYVNLKSNDYISVNLVNNNIVSVDINNEECNKLLAKFIADLERNIEKIEKGKINNYRNLEMIRGDNGIILFIPIGVGLNNSILSNFGPKIPIKASFLENVEAFVDVKVEEYGINNSLINIYININIEEIIEMPIDKDRTTINYKYLVASKLINGKVPNLLGDYLNSSSNIVNSGVN